MSSPLFSIAIVGGIGMAVYLLYCVPLQYSARSRVGRRNGYVKSPYKAPSRGVFGWKTYSTYREDSDALHGTIISKNPFTKHRSQKKKNRSQADSNCEVCHSECGMGIMNKDGGPYFEETWRAFYMFGIPFRYECTGWESYCPKHKPADWPQSTQSEPDAWSM